MERATFKGGPQHGTTMELDPDLSIPEEMTAVGGEYRLARDTPDQMILDGAGHVIYEYVQHPA